MHARTRISVLAAVALVSLAAIGAGAQSPARAAPAVDPPGGREPIALTAVAACPGTSGPARSGAWWEVAPRIDDAGTLRGWIVNGGSDAGALPTVALPAESSLSAEPGGRAAITADDGKRSIVAVASAGDRCVSIVHDDLRFVARGALVRAHDGTIWVHAVDRETRRDLGVFRILGGTRDVEPFLGPLPDDDPSVVHVGRVFATMLRLDTAGERLAVQSCGERTCRTRIVDLVDGRLFRLDAPDQGALASFDRRRAMFRVPCGSDACPLQAIEITPSATEYDR